MAGNLQTVTESVGVNPTEIESIDPQSQLIDHLIAKQVSFIPTARVYQDEAFIQGQQQIGPGICQICCAAPNEGFLFSNKHGLPSCGHAICAMCAGVIMATEIPTCPYCRQPILNFIRVLFS